MVLFYWMQPKAVFSRAPTGCCIWFYRCETFGSRADVGIGPYEKTMCVPAKNNVHSHCRVRCPHRPVGYVDRAVRENGHACTASHGPMWASAPTKKQCTFPQKTCILTVGGDAHIAPRGTSIERSDKRDRLLKCKRSSRTFCNRSGPGSGYLPLQQRP